MRNYRSIAAILVLLFSARQAQAGGRDLATSPASPAEVTGTYTLLLYGCHYADDIKDLAILVDQKEGIPVEIYDLPTSYKTEKDKAGPQALEEAEKFVRCSHRRVIGTELRRIRDLKGGTLGFEVRPLFFPLEFGQENVLFVNYTQSDGRVRIYIRLDPSVQRAIEGSGSDEERYGR